MLLALIVHLALIAALFLGVQWKTRHEAVEVELWSDVPRPATAPPPPTARTSPPQVKPEPPKPEIKPPPEPPKPVKPPVIATQPEEKKPPEPKKPEPKPKETPRQPERPDFMDLLKAEDQDRRNRQREEELRAAAAREGEARQAAAGREKALKTWIDEIVLKIRGNIVLPPVIEGNPEAVIVMTLLPSGEVTGKPRTKRSSGNAALDAAIERAILKSSPLPKPDDSSVFVREIEITYRPYD